MRVVSIEELEIHDRVVVQEDKDTLRVFTVKEVHPDDGLIVFKEMEPLDYAPEDPDQIVVMDDE
jgi:hypothetical protein